MAAKRRAHAPAARPLIKPLVRGELHFYEVGQNNIVCSLGPAQDPESEILFSVHRSWLPDLVAGLTALRRR